MNRTLVPRTLVPLAFVPLALLIGCSPTSQPVTSSSTTPETAVTATSPIPSPSGSPPVSSSADPPVTLKPPTSTEEVKVQHPAAVPPIVTGARFAEHGGFDRVVIDLKGDFPGYTVKWVSELVQDGSGDPIDAKGGAYLHLSMTRPPRTARRASRAGRVGRSSRPTSATSSTWSRQETSRAWWAWASSSTARRHSGCWSRRPRTVWSSTSHTETRTSASHAEPPAPRSHRSLGADVRTRNHMVVEVAHRSRRAPSVSRYDRNRLVVEVARGNPRTGGARRTAWSWASAHQNR